jgi:hypothetical protein
MLFTHLAALTLTASALVASGCGSSSKSESTNASTGTTAATTATTTAATTPSSTTPSTITSIKVASGKPLTSAQWIVKGDAICARLVTQISGTTARTQQQLAQALTQSAVYERAELARLAKLVPPSTKHQDWQEFLTGLDETAANSITLAGVAQTNKLNLHSPLVTKAQAIQGHMSIIAKHDGFKHCSQV